MRIARTLAAVAALAAAAACSQRPAAAPGPVAEQDFEYIANNSGRSPCAVSYRKKGDTTSVSVGQVAAGGSVSFVVRQPERGASAVLRAHCGDRSYTYDLRPGRRYVALAAPARGQASRCVARPGYRSNNPECDIPGGTERDAAAPSRRRDPRGPGNTTSGNGGAGRTDPTVREPATNP